mmetsp:Transcript_143824/g.460418  ORF Transcript_143824/g.460418 Transcript_143824/m.460418 type:complete len:84 (-) Transcript_143824:26-277(-)
MHGNLQSLQTRCEISWESLINVDSEFGPDDNILCIQWDVLAFTEVSRASVAAITHSMSTPHMIVSLRVACAYGCLSCPDSLLM